MHGAGVIEAIEEHEVLGQRHEYYVMHMRLGDLKVMIPVKSVSHIGLRQVICEPEVDRVMQVLRTRHDCVSPNWNRRCRVNLEKIKTGDIFEVADVVGSLIWRERDKGLSTCERRMLDSARQILVSELVLAKGVCASVVNTLLDEVFEQMA